MLADPRLQSIPQNSTMTATINRPLTMLKSLWSKAYFLLTFTALCWAGNAVVARGARELVPPVALAFWRWSFALVLVLPFAWPHLRRDKNVILTNLRILVLLGIWGIGAFNTLLYTGLQDTTALNAMLVQSAQPALILLIGAAIMGDRPGWHQFGGAGLALAGVVTIIGRGDPSILWHLRLNTGDLIIGIAVIFWSLYSVMLRRRPALHPLSLFAVTLLIGVLVIAPFYAWEILSGRRIIADFDSWLAIAYVSIFPSLIAYLFFNRSVELIGSAATGMYMNILPLLGAGLAILLLGEELHLFHVSGMALIVGGILWAGRGQAPLPAVPAKEADRSGHL